MCLKEEIGMHKKTFNNFIDDGFVDNLTLTGILQKPARMMDQKSEKLLTEGKVIRSYALAFTEGFYTGLCNMLVVAGIIYVGLLVAGRFGHESTIHFSKDGQVLISNDK